MLMSVPGHPPETTGTPDLKEEPSSQGQSSQKNANMNPPTISQSSTEGALPALASQTPSKKTAIPMNPEEVQVEASRSLPHEATPPKSDGLAPLSGSKENGVEDDDETDENPIHDIVDDEDETIHNLNSFDWADMERQYEAAMAECDEKEHESIQEFMQLANFFSQWSNVPGSEDKERNAKRYKTREAHIAHSETDFQKKKEHFDKVVDAFKSAMELLRNT